MPEDKPEAQGNRKHAVPGHKRDIQISIREGKKGASLNRNHPGRIGGDAA
ncbi:MAG: hypothetical protein ACTSUQ_05575 [Candidatus Freyarchaeota archaeon]